MAPNRNVVKPERVPPQIKHRLIETQNSFFRNTRGRRRELTQPIVHQHSLPLVDTRQQMPQRKCVTFPRLGKNNPQVFGALLRCACPQSRISPKRNGTPPAHLRSRECRGRPSAWSRKPRRQG